MHIGETFFPDNWGDEVYQTGPYTLNTNDRTLNSDDLSVVQQNEYRATTR